MDQLTKMSELILNRDTVGTEVYQLNLKLLQLGFTIPLTNSFDWQTDSAVRQFQEENHLVKDGLVGPKTYAALAKAKTKFRQTGTRFLHKCEYLSQRDNVNSPLGTCNTTALATVFKFHKDFSYLKTQLEDELTLELQSPYALAYFKETYPWFANQGYNPRNVHGMLGWLAKRYGFNWQFSDNFTFADIDTFGKSFGPMIISGSFTSSGHIVTLVGRTYNGDCIVHDPWGDWNTNYRSTNGAYRIYNLEDMKQILAGQDSEHKRVHRIIKENK